MQDTTRRGFWSSFWVGLVGYFVGSTSATAATKTDLSQIKAPAGSGLMGYANGYGVPVTIGAGLNLAGGVLTAPGTPPAARTYGVVLVRDVSGNYPLPSGVRLRSSIWRNGMRQAPTLDYTIVGDVVTPVAAYPWEPDATVLADGE